MREERRVHLRRAEGEQRAKGGGDADDDRRVDGLDDGGRADEEEGADGGGEERGRERGGNERLQRRRELEEELAGLKATL